MENLTSLSRKELQSIAKQLGIKANQSTSALLVEISENKEKNCLLEQQTRTLLTFNDGLEISKPKDNIEQFENKRGDESQYSVGCDIEAVISGKNCNAVIKKVNKKTLRVKLLDGSESESTILKSDIIRACVIKQTESSCTNVTTQENIESEKDLRDDNNHTINDIIPPTRLSHSLDVLTTDSNPSIATATIPIINTPSALRVEVPPPPPHMAASPVLKRRSFCGRTPVNLPRSTKAETLRRESTLARSAVQTAIKVGQ